MPTLLTNMRWWEQAHAKMKNATVVSGSQRGLARIYSSYSKLFHFCQLGTPDVN